MKTVTISVIIPVYNESAYIATCLKCVLGQKRQADEIIVVDNHSTDNTAEIVASFTGVKLIKEQRRGPGFARNKGFSFAKGDILVTIDADSRPRPNWLEQLSEAFDSGIDGYSGFVDIYSRSFRFRRFRRLVKIHQHWASALTNIFVYRLNHLISGQPMMFGSNMAIKKSVWRDIKSSIRLKQGLFYIWDDLEIATIANSRGYKISVFKQKSVDISDRGFNQSILSNCRRLLGWPRTYWPTNRRAAIIAACLIPAFICLHLLIRPVMVRHRQPTASVEG